MPGIPLYRLPATPRAAWLRLRDELRRIVGDDLVAVWAEGGLTGVDDPPHQGDLDTYVILARRPDAATARAIEEAHDAIARDAGVEWDAWYVLAEDARRPEPPRHAFHPERRDTAWALHRAHWLAGRYASLHGPDPAELVTAPAWPELEAELSRELEHVERHVVEGDTDPFEATYALLNGSRILHALETHDVALTKRAAGSWALEHLPAQWHPALEAAIRYYEGHPAEADAAFLAAAMPPFVEFLRQRLPDPSRSQGSLPRWSGY